VRDSPCQLITGRAVYSISKNKWALVMMGNIFSKFKNDVPTALKYYDQALIVDPNDNIVMNNIGANLMHQNKFGEAKKYFLEAIKINNEYPNTHYAVGLIAEMENDLQSAFYSTIQSIKLNKNQDVLFENSIKQAIGISKKIISTDTGKTIYNEYRYKLEFDCGKKVEIVEDPDISTAAKIELAENHNRLKHIIKFKPSYLAIEHLIIHELVHLDFMTEARKEELNQLFISTQNYKTDFIKTLEPTILKLQKMGIGEGEINRYCSNLYEGINQQVYNTPIDLFIENFIYNEFPEVRPFQFVSLYTLINESLKAFTDKEIPELSPKDLFSKSKIYNIVNALQFKDLYGIDLIKDFQPTSVELKQAKGFYDEYLQYKDDKEPAEEYELVLHWAEDLKLDKYFELVNEKEYHSKSTDLDHILSSIEKDPFDINTKDPFKEREMEKFQKEQEKIGTNMAVVMFMIDALQYFKNIPKEEVNKIAIEIALQGTQGYSPDKMNYRLNSIPGKDFSGYHILAYYYVSFAIAIPELLSKLQLPYDEEYKLAQTMNNTNI
ncbi:MAG: tetratricopeptide repeat protein, partial [Bacteroidales bacterium]